MDENMTARRITQEFSRYIGLKIYYVENGKIFVAIMNGKLCDIRKAKPRAKINPHAIVVEHLDATFEAIDHADGRLYLDGFALTDLWAWLHSETPNASLMTFGRRLYRMFPGSADISALMRATIRCATGNEHQAHGEDAYFCGKVRDAHPAEFAELREYIRQHQHH